MNANKQLFFYLESEDKYTINGGKLFRWIVHVIVKCHVSISKLIFFSFHCVAFHFVFFHWQPNLNRQWQNGHKEKNKLGGLILYWCHLTKFDNILISFWQLSDGVYFHFHWKCKMLERRINKMLEANMELAIPASHSSVIWLAVSNSSHQKAGKKNAKKLSKINQKLCQEPMVLCTAL